ncbi:MAG: hypothetical protein H0V82_11120 [Candidatus Protochlamydia sp.]|nr:hypothetical protein [Candidatus Protochlamydia sp.]
MEEEDDYNYYVQDPFAGCRYEWDDIQFAKLQRYAKLGNIISVIGDINDLTFLNNRKISIVDTSNILDYCLLNLRGNISLNTRIIWTQSPYQGSTYNSYIHYALSEDEELEFNALINRLNLIPTQPGKEQPLRRLLSLKHYDPFNADFGPIYSKATLQGLKNIIEKKSL